MSGEREIFEIEGPKQESRVEKMEGAKEEEEKQFDYQIMKSEKYQNVNKERSLNETCNKEKGNMKFHRNKNTKKEKKQKVTKKEITLKAT